jgi:hypothetical protein
MLRQQVVAGRAHDDDLLAEVLPRLLEAEGHPARVMGNGFPARAAHAEGSAVASLRITEPGLSSPGLDRALIEVRDEALGIAHVRRGGQRIEEPMEVGSFPRRVGSAASVSARKVKDVSPRAATVEGQHTGAARRILQTAAAEQV